MKKIFLVAFVIMLFANVGFAQQSKHTFEPLPYAYDALEPYIDKTTMEIHYDRHHRAYFNNFTKEIKGTALENMDIRSIFANISKYNPIIRNNGGGYWNHTFFWNSMRPNGGGEPQGKLLTQIIKDFGSFNEFKKQFEDAAAKRFGSGWAWLMVEKGTKKLTIVSTANQDNPLMNIETKRGEPLLCLDVWEHAYYLKYQNRRPEYISAFWNVVNWDKVTERYEKAK